MQATDLGKAALRSDIMAIKPIARKVNALPEIQPQYTVRIAG